MSGQFGYEPYTPPGSNVSYTVPSLDDPADGPEAFRRFADSIPPIGGPTLRINKQSTDYTLVKDDMAGIVQFDTTDGNLKVNLPAADTLDVPVGSVVVISNMGSTAKKRVTITPAQGVTIRNSADREVQQYCMVTLVKVDTNFWLINSGASGGGTATVPTAPTLTLCAGGPASAYVGWSAPADDGGTAITTYVVEQSTDQVAWSSVDVVTPTTFTALIDGLQVGATYYFRVKASNAVGFSEPSNAGSAVPTNEYNEATGGTVSSYEKDGRFYRVHKFESAGTFKVIKSANPFDVLVVAGGTGGGNDFSGYGGNGGGWSVFTLPPNECGPGDYQIAVGNAGFGPANPLQPGGQSSAFGRLGVPNAGAGGGAPSGNPNPSPPGNPGGTGVASDILTGATDYYGSGGGGGGGINGTPGNPGPGYYGRGGTGSNWSSAGWGGESGKPGVVIIRYEIASFNDAIGGEETVVDNYNGTGEKWKVHRFIGTNTLRVISAKQEFRVLVVGGGGGGSPGGGDIRDGYGGGGNGGDAVEKTMPLAEGTFNVTVGGGAPHIQPGPGSASRNGEAGGPSSLASFLSANGGRGGLRNTPANSPTLTSNITGTSITYGVGGCSNCCHTAQNRHSEGANGLGNGGGGQEQGQNTSETFGCQGGSGVVIVAYRIG